MGKNQKVIKTVNDELIVKNYPQKKQTVIQKSKLKLLNCPSCKRNNWVENDKGWFCQICEYNINKQKHQIDKMVLGQDHNFSTRLRFADKNTRGKNFPLANIKYDTSQDMINKVEQLKGKTNLKFYQKVGKYYDEMNYRRQSGYFRFEEDVFSKSVQGIAEIMHGILLLLKFLQFKTQVMSVNKNYDLYYTVIKNSDKEEEEELDEDDKNINYLILYMIILLCQIMI